MMNKQISLTDCKGSTNIEIFRSMAEAETRPFATFRIPVMNNQLYLITYDRKAIMDSLCYVEWTKKDITFFIRHEDIDDIMWEMRYDYQELLGTKEVVVGERMDKYGWDQVCVEVDEEYSDIDKERVVEYIMCNLEKAVRVED